MSSVIFTICSICFLLKRRRTIEIPVEGTEIIPPELRKLWQEWQLQGVVLLSLAVQIMLIFLGSRRKHNRSLWVRVGVWCAYLEADSIAIAALGMISSNLQEIDDKKGTIDANVELTAFWAPFLLLHLGGPDTITAYAVEDNELWLRHFLGLGTQAGITIYVFFLAWTGSHLSFLAVLMVVAGVIKYGERTWVLWSSSNDKLRESMMARPDQDSKTTTLDGEEELKQAEGYRVTSNRAIQVDLPVESFIFEDASISEDHVILASYGLFQKFQRIFVDLKLSSQNQETGQTIIRNVSFDKAFKVVEIELGFMYDLLYTKARLFYTLWGNVLRFISFALTCVVLVVFSFTYRKHKYSTVNIFVTFSLLASAILLDIYGTLVRFASDWTVVWLNKHQQTCFSGAISAIRLLKSPRWSNSMGQFSLISFCLGEKPMYCHRVMSLLAVGRKLELHLKYITYEEVPGSLKEQIFLFLQKELRGNEESTATDPSGRSRQPGLRVPEDLRRNFGRQMLVLHVSTELCCCYFDDSSLPESIRSKKEVCKYLSRYMLYLLVMYPFMLPAAFGQTEFEDTCNEAMKLFEPVSSKDRVEAYQILLPEQRIPGSRSGDSVMFTAGNHARDMQRYQPEGRWNFIMREWIHMLMYAASECGGTQHAQQLRRGGELLSHVWLLMAHFGLTGHFHDSEPSRPITKLEAM